jgi:hypothetical protein
MNVVKTLLSLEITKNMISKYQSLLSSFFKEPLENYNYWEEFSQTRIAINDIMTQERKRMDKYLRIIPLEADFFSDV